MSGILNIDGILPVLDANGNPVNGATIEFFEAGTSTPKNIYSDSALTVVTGNTLTTNAGGEPIAPDTSIARVWWAGNDEYYDIKVSFDAVVRTYDNISTSSGNGQVGGFYELSSFKQATDPDWTLAFRRALDFFGDTGGICWIKPSATPYDVTGINHNKPVTFIGLGTEGGQDHYRQGSVVIRHVGTTDTDLVHMNNGTSTSHLVGGGYENIMLHFNNKARHTLRITDVQRWRLRDVFIYGALTTGLLLDNGSATANPCGWGEVTNLAVDCHISGSESANGIHLRGRIGSPNTGISMITWNGVKIQHTNGDGLILDAGDGNVFTRPFVFSYGTGYSYRIRGADSTNWNETTGKYTGSPNPITAPVIASTFMHPIFGRADGLGSTKGFYIEADLSLHETTLSVIDYPAGDGQPAPCGTGADCVEYQGIDGFKTRALGWVTNGGTIVNPSFDARAAYRSSPQFNLSRRNSDTGYTDFSYSIRGEQGGRLEIYNVLTSQRLATFQTGAFTLNCASASNVCGVVFNENNITRANLQKNASGFLSTYVYSSIGAFIGEPLSINCANGAVSLPMLSGFTTASAANVNITGGQLYTSTSSIKYKKDVEDINLNIAKNTILNLRPVFYRSKAEADPKNWGYWGFIAEEVAEIDKRLVQFEYTETDFDIVDNTKILKEGSIPSIPNGVQYDRVVPLLVKTIQDLETRLAALEGK